MLWIKRNLFLAVGGLITMVLVGGGSLFLYTRLSKNKALEASIEEKLANLRRLNTMTPSPTQTNIFQAKAELTNAHAAVERAKTYFAPVEHEKLTGLAFKTSLDNTIVGLRKKAEQASVRLPNPSCAFSFTWEKGVLTLPPESFPTLPIQLAEVAEICGILFDARINALESISRPRISGTEPSSEDYHDLATKTNTATKMVLTYYKVTFLSFSAELAGILNKFCESKHGLVVKSLQADAIMPESAAASRQPGPPGVDTGPSPDRPAGPGAPPAGPGGVRRRAAASPTRDDLETVIDERLLKVILLIEVIKPSA